MGAQSGYICVGGMKVAHDVLTISLVSTYKSETSLQLLANYEKYSVIVLYFCAFLGRIFGNQ